MRTMDSTRTTRRLLLAAALLASTAVMPAAASAAPCGFYFTSNDPVGAHSRYRHCADSFILIRVDWRDGTHRGECVSPWSSKPFFRSSDNYVTNAYYVRTPPRVLTIDGRRMCSLSQPAV